MERPRYNKHHTAHSDAFWSAHESTRRIRDNPSLIVFDMPVDAHAYLHAKTAAVPTPDVHTAQYVAPRLDTRLDVLDGIDEYSRLIELAIARPKSREIEKRLGELSIAAIRAQIPFIKDTGYRRVN